MKPTTSRATIAISNTVPIPGWLQRTRASSAIPATANSRPRLWTATNSSAGFGGYPASPAFRRAPATPADANESLTETITYDTLNRFASATVSHNIAPVKSFICDASFAVIGEEGGGSNPVRGRKRAGTFAVRWRVAEQTGVRMFAGVHANVMPPLGTISSIAR